MGTPLASVAGGGGTGVAVGVGVGAGEGVTMPADGAVELAVSLDEPPHAANRKQRPDTPIR
jgi:hypothetical protein